MRKLKGMRLALVEIQAGFVMATLGCVASGAALIWQHPIFVLFLVIGMAGAVILERGIERMKASDLRYQRKYR